MYIRRYLEEEIRNLHETFKVLYVGGPRQVGKTTMLRSLAETYGMRYITLDDITERTLAQRDPELFLKQHTAPLLLDEAQYAPQLFPYIKIQVDNSQKRGQYWLTGSQQFSLMRNMQESLAGRVGIVRLLGLSAAEIYTLPRNPNPFLPGTKHQKISSVDTKDVFRIITRGSFPALWEKPNTKTEPFYRSYIQTTIDRDLRDFFGIEKIEEFHTFLRFCALRTGQLLNYSDLARDADISVHAAKEWINILVNTSQIYLLRPYYKNPSKRMIKAPKLYMLDTGLAAYLAGWKSSEDLRGSAMAGAFFETFAISEIIKSYLFRGIDPPLYAFRDKEGHEVDLLIEHKQKLHPVEIKIASAPKEKQLPGLAYFNRKFAEQADTGAVICLTSEERVLNRNTTLMPIGSVQ